MERGLILLAAAALMVFVAPGVRGTSHLSFSNNTQVNITRDGCGVSKLCVETPNDCDPSPTSGACLFGSAIASTPMVPDGSTLTMQLRGNSTGYVALGLNVNPAEGTSMLFICAQNSSNNGSFFFRTMQSNNTDGGLTPTETRVKEIRGMVSGNVIKCEFEIPNVNATSTRSSRATLFTILLGTGTFDGNMLGPFNVALNSPVNLANPAGTVTTAAPSNMTTASASDRVHSHAVLLVLSVLTLPFMLRA